MSAKMYSSLSQRRANLNPIDIEADAPGLVKAFLRFEKLYLDPFLDPNCQIDTEKLPPRLQEQLLIHQQYSLLCEWLDDGKSCTLNVLLQNLCIKYFQYGWEFALEEEEE